LALTGHPFVPRHDRARARERRVFWPSSPAGRIRILRLTIGTSWHEQRADDAEADDHRHARSTISVSSLAPTRTFSDAA